MKRLVLTTIQTKKIQISLDSGHETYLTHEIAVPFGFVHYEWTQIQLKLVIQQSNKLYFILDLKHDYGW